VDKEQKLSRRNFLRLSGAAAASTMIAACGGTTTTPAPAGAPTAAGAATAPTAAGAAPASGGATTVPIAAPGKYKDAPMLAEMVTAGKLPAVDQRLPKSPYVPPHAWLKTGKYGGTIQRSANWTEGIVASIQESMYGHSPLRYLKDGLEIGPGLVESWESNPDASEWTLHFREGLKWSDGQPWTTADVMFWWEDMILNEDHQTEGAPDEARSGKGTLMKLEKVDDFTLKMVFDAPAPLTADRLAMWVNGNAGKPIGPSWMAPKHYVQQFHPKYTPSVGTDWVETFNQKAQYRINPECPTMTGWMLQSYEEGVRSVWTRNPYYWVVDKEGNQLPYVDGLICTGYQDKEVQKLSFLEGKIDYDHFHALTLADVKALRDAQPQSKVEARFWDSGSGTASLFFFNFDYKDDKMRELIRNPKFRKALSLAYNRAEVQKVVYFNTGELTTGTMSPKAIEYNINDQGKAAYASWRDLANKYDPEAAKALLDEIGVKAGADGKRTMPDGSPLAISIDYPSDTGNEHLQKNELMAKDWQAIGIDGKLNPVEPTGYDEKWKAAEYMSKTAWEVGDGPNHLVYPQWVVPLEFSRWAPLHGGGYNERGTPKENSEADKSPWDRSPPRFVKADKQIDPAIQKLWDIYDQTKVEPDVMKRHALVWDMIKIHVESGPFYMGTVANYPRIVLVKEGLMNVPTAEDLKANGLGGFVNPWIHPTPAVYDPETWFWDNPDAHK
jgi:peptide/nickel transport system substrate-binding protein